MSIPTPAEAVLADNEYLMGISGLRDAADPSHHVFSPLPDGVEYSRALAPAPFVAFFKSAADLAAGGYVNCTTIILLKRFGLRGGRDFGFVREQIRFVLGRNAWETLTLEEQRICCVLMLVPPATALPLFTLEEQMNNAKVLNARMSACRADRLADVCMELRYCLSEPDYNTVMTDVMTSGHAMRETCIEFGRLGTVEDAGNVGILDYVKSRPTGPFSQNGFSAKSNMAPIAKYSDMASFADGIQNTILMGKFRTWNNGVSELDI